MVRTAPPPQTRFSLALFFHDPYIVTPWIGLRDRERKEKLCMNFRECS